MIQFNLLPDVKLEYVKAQRTKRMVMGAALIGTATTFAIFALLSLAVYGVQKKNLSDLNADIKQYSGELTATPDLNKILTIQNQLAAVNGLHEQKPEAARVFAILQQVTPTDVTMTELKTDFVASTLTLTGEAPSLDRINTFADTLKFVKFGDPGDETTGAFKDVVLSQFSRNDTKATYTITMTFDPAMFTNQQSVSLSVPNTITTRSIVEQPSDIFKKATDSSSTESN